MTLICPPESHSWIAREATVDDIPAINELFHTVFGLTRDRASTRWKFFQNPSGPPLVMVAEDHGRIVGSYTLWPVRIRVGHEVVQGAQSVDTMTHPDYRRRGILRELAGAGMEMAAASGVELLYGFPNECSYPASIKMKWHHIGNVNNWRRPLRADALRRLPRAARPAVSLALMAWPRADTRGFTARLSKPPRDAIAALLADRHAGGTDCQVERTSDWYDWRFSARVGRTYEWVNLEAGGRTAAYAIWGREHAGNTAVLAEVVGASDVASAAAVACVLDQARAVRCSAVTTSTNRPEMQRALRTNGFRKIGEMPFKVRGLTRRLFGADVRDFANWQILGADCDIY